MPQSLSLVYVHLTFSTAGRQRWLDASLRPALFTFTAGVFQRLESPAEIVGGHDDHLHALFILSRNHAIKKVVQDIKTTTSQWMKRQGNEYRDFRWQAGYASFSVSASNLSQVRRYIEDQETHHRKRSFQDEVRLLLKKHRMEYDEQHLWD
ncbi:MAG: transposase [Candidatus Hydrogenedens sp.]|nr:transposase [Candidatus Hydrogenedens sp.]